MTVEVWYPLGVAGAGASFAASGVATLRSRVDTGRLAAAAAGALAVIVAFDLVPDVRADARSAGVPAAVLAMTVAVTLAALAATSRQTSRSRTAPGAGPLAPAFLVHGFLEGFAGGTALGWQATIGIGLLAALVLHKAAEGADLAAALRAAHGRTRRLSWLAAAAAAPLAGCAAALVLQLPDSAGAVVMTAVCCALARAVVALGRGAAARLALAPVAGAAVLGAGTMAVLIAALPG